MSKNNQNTAGDSDLKNQEDTGKEKGEKMVSVSEEMLKQVLKNNEEMAERLATLESAESGINRMISNAKPDILGKMDFKDWDEIPERQYTAQLRKYQDKDGEWKLVTGWEKIKEDADAKPPLHLYRVYFTDYKGKKAGDMEMELKDLVGIYQNEPVKVIKRNITTQRKVYGFTTRKEVDYDNYRTKDTGERVPMEVIRQKITLTVELSNGLKLTLPEEFFNGIGIPK